MIIPAHMKQSYAPAKRTVDGVGIFFFSFRLVNMYILKNILGLCQPVGRAK